MDTVSKRQRLEHLAYPTGKLSRAEQKLIGQIVLRSNWPNFGVNAKTTPSSGLTPLTALPSKFV